MKRRELREHIFRLLFRVEFNDAADMPEQVALYMEDLPMAGEQDRRYIEKKYELVMEHLEKIDEMLNEAGRPRMEGIPYGKGRADHPASGCL